MQGSKWHISGKSVLITGAAGGIGAATARLLAARQAHLTLVDVHGDALRQLASDLGGKVICHEVDITQPEALNAAMAGTLDHFGQLDVAVVNAGVVTVGSVERGDPRAFEQVITVNLIGSWQTVRAALPHIIAARGYILFVSSLAGTIQGPLHAAYNSSKAGLQAFANTLRLEVQGLGVDIGIAHLIYTATETARGAVEHPLMRGLPGLRAMKPQPVEETAALLVRGIERRSRTIATPAARLALLAPDVFQLALEGMARRRGWSANISKQGQLYIMCGLPYSGKTTLQKELVKRLRVQVVSVDQIMDEKDMWREGHPTQEDWNAAYSEAYRQIQAYLKEGKTVIFECGNLPFHERENARNIAESLAVSHRLIYVNTPKEDILRRRQHNEKTNERGHLDLEMMEKAFKMFDEPTESEHPIIYNHHVDLDQWVELYFHK